MSDTWILVGMTGSKESLAGFRVKEEGRCGSWRVLALELSAQGIHQSLSGRIFRFRLQEVALLERWLAKPRMGKGWPGCS